MVELGICATTRHYPDAAECQALGIGSGDWLRLHCYSLAEIDAALQAIRADINIFLNISNELAEVRHDWSGWEVAIQAVTRLRTLSRIKIVGCANELDLWHLQPPVGSPDPRLTPAFAASLVRRASPILRSAGIKVAMSSVASGSWTGYLADMARHCAGAADYADLHLYMKQVNGVPNDPNWQPAGDALREAARLSGLPVIASEAGIKVDDAGGRDMQARWAAGLGGLPAELVCYFAWADSVGTPSEQGGQAFGARDPQGRQKPVWGALQKLFSGPTNHPPTPHHAEFQLGFLEWSRADPSLLGQPLENERGGVPGFSVQKTSTGRLMASNLIGRGWALTFWRDSDGARFLFNNGRSEQIA